VTILERVEKLIDKKYFDRPLPHPNSALAKWYFLIAAEDMQQFMLSRNDGISSGSIEYFIDRVKYSLKYGLARIEKECIDSSRQILPRRVNGFNYERGFELLESGNEYSAGSQICSSAHNETVILRETENEIRLVVDEKYHQKGYALLEMIGHQPSDSVSFMQIIFSLVHLDDEIPFIVERIADGVKLKGKMLSYEYDSYLAADLSTIFPQPPFLIPDDWKFEWGGRYETTLLLNSLSLRCAYHFLAIYFSARKRNLSGGGCNDLVLVIQKEELYHDIEILSSLPHEVIQIFVDKITYGVGVKSPDPALQPIIPLGGNLLAIAPLHILSCHLERNLLALHARTNSREFNAMSAAFEDVMTARIIAGLTDKWSYIDANVTWAIDGEKEEMDILIADVSNRRLLVCELRWTIQPGDPREVQQRKEYCFEKVVQLRRKVEWLRPNIVKAVSEIFKISTEECAGAWQVDGVVVIDGFGGVQSKDDAYPIIPAKIFEFAMDKISSLNQFNDWIKSLDWLPQENVYFEMKDRRIQLEGVDIAYEGMEVIQERPQYFDYIASTIARYQPTNF